jgi:hypothetical protein
LLAPRATPIPEDQASVFISPRGRVATHFSRLLRHVWVMVGLFLFPGHHTGNCALSQLSSYPNAILNLSLFTNSPHGYTLQFRSSV